MANPTLTKDSLRSIVLELIAETLASRPDSVANKFVSKADRPRVDYDALTIRAFKKAGYPSVTPRVDVKTYDLWISEGRKVKESEKSIKVKNLRLFHLDQTQPISAKEKSAYLKAKADRILAKGGTPKPQPEPEKPAPRAKKAKAQPQPAA